MADAAGCPEFEVIDCVRAVEIPAVGSAFDIGHRYLDGRFLEAASPFADAAEPVDPADAFVSVEAVEEIDDSDDDEFDRVAVFRGGITIRETTSSLMEGRPLEDVLDCPHACLLRFWKLGGGATAVMKKEFEKLRRDDCWSDDQINCYRRRYVTRRGVRARLSRG
jgi:hypothetical protein